MRVQTVEDVPAPSWIDARRLATPDRLDLVVKRRFFAHLLNSGDPDSERVYRWHIDKRTGGREPGSWKRSVDDYVRAAAELLASVAACGFDPRYPVVVGSNGRLRAGAHRTALGLLLGKRIYVLRVAAPGRARPFDIGWFERAGMTAADLARVVADWEALQT